MSWSNTTCSELSWYLVHSCAGELFGTLERQQAQVVETVVFAADTYRAAQWWQLAAGWLITASLLYHHGRWMAWISLSISLLSMQALYVGWQMGMIVFNVVLCAHATRTQISIPERGMPTRAHSLACSPNPRRRHVGAQRWVRLLAMRVLIPLGVWRQHPAALAAASPRDARLLVGPVLRGGLGARRARRAWPVARLGGRLCRVGRDDGGAAAARGARGAECRGARAATAHDDGAQPPADRPAVAAHRVPRGHEAQYRGVRP